MRYAIISGLVIASMALSSDIAVAQSNFYVFGTIGNTDADIAFDGRYGVDDDDGSFSLGGGYEFSEHVSLEGAYEDFGTQAGQTNCPPEFFCILVPLRAKADLDALSVSVIGSFSISDKLDGYGKLGLTAWDIEFEGISSAFDDTGEDVHYGVGLRWSFEGKWKVFAEYKQVDLDIDTLRIGLRFDF